jgi:hypothetical protein
MVIPVMEASSVQRNLLWKEMLNSGGQLFHQYEQK